MDIEIQRKHYSTSTTSKIDEINDWLESPPIQEPMPDNMTAEQDIKWLMAWWRTNFCPCIRSWCRTSLFSWL
jgi:hypothetical protein